MNSFSPWRRIAVVAFAAAALLWLTTRTHAAQPDIAPALRQAIARQATVAGPVLVRGGASSDPVAAAVGASIASTLRIRPPASATPVTLAAGAVTSANAGLAAPAGAAPTAPDHRGAIARLSAVSGPSMQVYLRGNRTVSQIRADALADATVGIVAKSGGGDALERAALLFLDAHRDLIGLDDPRAELQLAVREGDELAHTHLKFEQRFQGLPVWPAHLNAQFDGLRRLRRVSGAYVPTPRLASLLPRIPADAAVARAKAGLPGGWVARTTEPELIVYAPLDEAPRLGWKFDLEIGFSHAWRIVVDAESARLLHRSSRVFDTQVAGSGVDLTGATRPLKVWKQGTEHFLLDTSKPMFDATSDPINKPKGVITIADARGVEIKQLNDNNIALITAASPDAWSVAAGVSAAFNFSETYDYFLQRHNRNSLDGNGGNVTAIVRVGNYDNASWHGNLSLMMFGEVKPYAASLDVVGHELAHGVTEKSANLVYALEPGALNEAFSDIFGEMVEARSRGRNDWIMGSELGRAFRNMKDPGSLQIGGLNRPYPSKMSEFVKLPNDDDSDHGGVHINSSIINHCFYLLAEGLPGRIGLIDAERIFYRTLTRHLQAQSQFIDCRLGAIASAEELFGKDSSQAQSTAAAFDAVEIWAAPVTPEPTPVPVVQGADSTLFIYPGGFGLGYDMGRNETALGDTQAGAVFATGVKLQRPAVSGDGSGAAFVTEDFDLCLVDTADPFTRQCLGVVGLVHSVALSPDLRYAAFVLRDAATGQPDGRISVVTLADSSTRTFTLVSPAADGLAVDQVLYADSMTFTTDGSELIYDSVSRVRFGTAAPVERWSISALHLDTETTRIIVPPLDGIDSGNPSLGRAGNRYLTFDAVVQSTGNSSIIVLDLFSGDLVVAGVSERNLGYPIFAGDERAVIFAVPDGNLFGPGVSLVRQGLSSTRLQTEGALTVWQRDAYLGVVYRRGAFVANNRLPDVTLTATASPGPVPATVTLVAKATDPDGTIARVQFFDGNLQVGETASAVAGEYRLSYPNVAAGTHRLYARAIDNTGGSADSEAVVISLGVPGKGPTLSAARAANGNLQITIRGLAGTQDLQRSTDLVTWTTLRTVTADGTGNATAEEPLTAGAAGRAFFRVRSR